MEDGIFFGGNHGKPKKKSSGSSSLSQMFFSILPTWNMPKFGINPNHFPTRPWGQPWYRRCGMGESFLVEQYNTLLWNELNDQVFWSS